jgi:hypothetical protein
MVCPMPSTVAPAAFQTACVAARPGIRILQAPAQITPDLLPVFSGHSSRTLVVTRARLTVWDPSYGIIEGISIRWVDSHAVVPCDTPRLSIMDYSLALQFFALMLVMIGITLVPIFIRRDPVPVRSIIRIDMLPRTRWPGLLTRVGVVRLLASFVMLLGVSCLLLPV